MERINALFQELQAFKETVAILFRDKVDAQQLEEFQMRIRNIVFDKIEMNDCNDMASPLGNSHVMKETYEKILASIDSLASQVAENSDELRKTEIIVDILTKNSISIERYENLEVLVHAIASISEPYAKFDSSTSSLNRDIRHICSLYINIYQRIQKFVELNSQLKEMAEKIGEMTTSTVTEQLMNILMKIQQEHEDFGKELLTLIIQKDCELVIGIEVFASDVVEKLRKLV